MNGQAIGTQAIGAASLRRLAGEQAGPRPAVVQPDATAAATPEMRTARATRP